MIVDRFASGPVRDAKTDTTICKLPKFQEIELD